MLGAIALVASTGHPADGVALTRTAAAILAATDVVAVALAFVPLGSVDPSGGAPLAPARCASLGMKFQAFVARHHRDARASDAGLRHLNPNRFRNKK